jgi:hypothetical protein
MSRSTNNRRVPPGGQSLTPADFGRRAYSGDRRANRLQLEREAARRFAADAAMSAYATINWEERAAESRAARSRQAEVYFYNAGNYRTFTPAPATPRELATEYLFNHVAARQALDFRVLRARGELLPTEPQRLVPFHPAILIHPAHVRLNMHRRPENQTMELHVGVMINEQELNEQDISVLNNVFGEGRGLSAADRLRIAADLMEYGRVPSFSGDPAHGTYGGPRTGRSTTRYDSRGVSYEEVAAALQQIGSEWAENYPAPPEPSPPPPPRVPQPTGKRKLDI